MIVIKNKDIKKDLIFFTTKLNNFKNNLDFDKKQKRIHEINTIFENNLIWKNTKLVTSLCKERAKIENILKNIDYISNYIKKSFFLYNLLTKKQDEQKISKILNNFRKIKKIFLKLEIFIKFNNKHDYSNCYIDIQPGTGGVDAQDWAYIMFKMYLYWAENKKFKTEIIHQSVGEIAGIKSATIHIIGKYAYGLLKNETGIHRLIRKSPFNSNQKRHTSFSSAFVYPDILDKEDIIINPADLRIDVYKSSGAGGQHVNCTESAVRIMHIPTKIVVQCQNNRSQHKNKEQAMRQIKAKIYELNLQHKKNKQQKIENKKSDITWGSQIRSYFLDNSLVKDLRSGLEKRNIQEILNGDLDDFINANFNLNNT